MKNLFAKFNEHLNTNPAEYKGLESTRTVVMLLHFSCTQDKYKKSLENLGSKVDTLKTALEANISQYVELTSTRSSASNNNVAEKIKRETSPKLSRIMELSSTVESELQGKEVSLDQISFEAFLVSLDRDSTATKETSEMIMLQQSGLNVAKLRSLKLETTKSTNAESPEDMMKDLESICINLNELAKAGKIDPVVGRKDEMLRVVEVLCKKKKNNPVLLGEAGVGKTAIPEALALRIVSGDVPEVMKKMVIYSLSVGDALAGTKFRGEFEEKMQKLMKTFVALEEQGDIIPVLFVDEIHQIQDQSGGGSGVGFGEIIKPALSRGQLRCIGATTEKEWNQFIKQDKAMKRRFSAIMVNEPSRAECIEILMGAKVAYEAKHGVTYSDEAIIGAVDLAIKYITDSKLPDKALDLMDYTGSMFKLREKFTLDKPEVEESLSRTKNIPLSQIREVKIQEMQYEPLAPKIKAQLFGQDHAVDKVTDAFETHIAGLGEPNKPIGAFLCAGPTGVGKTELANTLGQLTNYHVERIDMSEYMEEHSVAKLIGAPPGYVGYGTGGRLVNAVEKHPNLILLLDEMEKSHPKVQDIFLQAMDNAKVTDSNGDEVSFKNVLILMTSNAGAKASQERTMVIGDTTAPKQNKQVNAIRNFFRPEFLNRLNDVILFNPLSPELVLHIVDKVISKINIVRLQDKGITLELDSDAKKWVVDHGYDAQMGARPIQRLVDQKIVHEIRRSILTGEIKAGKKKVLVSVENGELKFTYNE